MVQDSKRETAPAPGKLCGRIWMDPECVSFLGNPSAEVSQALKEFYFMMSGGVVLFMIRVSFNLRVNWNLATVSEAFYVQRLCDYFLKTTTNIINAFGGKSSLYSQ